MNAGSIAYAASAAVEVRGTGDTVALLLHGLGGDRRQPLGLLAEPVVQGVTVVAPDQRAHGETDLIGEPDDFTIDRLADDATALLAAHGLDGRPLIVVGISMGAAVALRLLQRGQHDLRGGLLIRPAFETEPWPEHLRCFREIASLLRARDADGLDEFMASERYRAVADVSEACAKSLREQFTKPRAAARVVRLETVPGNPSITWDGRWTPPCPVTIMGAEADPVHPSSVAELWHERISSDLVRQPSRDGEPEEYQRILLGTTAACLSSWS